MEFRIWLETTTAQKAMQTAGTVAVGAMKAVPVLGTAIDVVDIAKKIWSIWSKNPSPNSLVNEIKNLLKTADVAGKPANPFDLEDSLAARLTDQEQTDIANLTAQKIDNIFKRYGNDMQTAIQAIPEDAANIVAIQELKKIVDKMYGTMYQQQAAKQATRPRPVAPAPPQARA